MITKGLGLGMEGRSTAQGLLKNDRAHVQTVRKPMSTAKFLLYHFCNYFELEFQGMSSVLLKEIIIRIYNCHSILHCSILNSITIAENEQK